MEILDFLICDEDKNPKMVFSYEFQFFMTSSENQEVSNAAKKIIVNSPNIFCRILLCVLAMGVLRVGGGGGGL